MFAHDLLFRRGRLKLSGLNVSGRLNSTPLLRRRVVRSIRLGADTLILSLAHFLLGLEPLILRPLSLRLGGPTLRRQLRLGVRHSAGTSLLDPILVFAHGPLGLKSRGRQHLRFIGGRFPLLARQPGKLST